MIFSIIESSLFLAIYGILVIKTFRELHAKKAKLERSSLITIGVFLLCETINLTIEIIGFTIWDSNPSITE